MNVVSLFSGLGGLDKGFADTGYNIVWANDFDKYAVQTYKANFGDHIVLGDINEKIHHRSDTDFSIRCWVNDMHALRV